VLTEFISSFFEELLIDYVFQSKIITDGKDENDDMTKEKVKAAEEKKEKLNELLFYSIIALAKGVREALKSGSQELTKINKAKWSGYLAEERVRLFSNLTNLLVGGDSLLRTLTMFGYHTVLYDISFTDLDEVSEAMQ
jgi:hypothetical protein